MRRIRKRVINERPPYQIGFGITFSVFLSLCGIIVFERIMLGVVFAGISHYPATDVIVFLYRSDDTLGPFEWMAVALAGLSLAQAFRAIEAWQRRETSWSGFVFGVCNAGMIVGLAAILVINWAFYYPLNPGAHTVNGLSKFIRSDFVHYGNEELRQRLPIWEQLDAHTYCHPGADIIEREEVIKPNFPIENQRANYLARNPDRPEFFHDASRTAKHYYDLDWNLLTINASRQWPIVREKLEAAGKEPWDGDSEVYYRFRDYENAPEAHYPGCKGRITAPAPPHTYPHNQAVNSE